MTKSNSNSFTVQVRVNAVLDVEVSATTIEDAIETGNNIGWGDLLASNVTLSDGNKKTYGVWNNNWDLEIK
jgi:hypothetical protein